MPSSAALGVIIACMSRLRRLVVSDRWFFITCRLLPTRGILKVEYIHLNPVRAGLVSRAEEWPRSSVHDYTGSVQRPLATPRKRKSRRVSEERHSALPSLCVGTCEEPQSLWRTTLCATKLVRWNLRRTAESLENETLRYLLCGFAGGFAACAISCQITSANASVFDTCIFHCEASLAGSAAAVCGPFFLTCVFSTGHEFNGPKTCPYL